jgi:hypothetical protein
MNIDPSSNRQTTAPELIADEVALLLVDMLRDVGIDQDYAYQYGIGNEK